MRGVGGRRMRRLIWGSGEGGEGRCERVCWGEGRSDFEYQIVRGLRSLRVTFVTLPNP